MLLAKTTATDRLRQSSVIHAWPQRRRLFWRRRRSFFVLWWQSPDCPGAGV